MRGGSLAIILSVVLGIWTLVHAYVLWRLAGIPWVAQHVSPALFWGCAAAAWLSYPVARFLERRHWDLVGLPLEWIGATWLGILFLLLAGFVAAEVLTLGGFLFPREAATVRTGAAILAGLFAAIGLIQGLSPPVVRQYEVRLARLPRERDGLRLLVLSDLHLGSIIGRRWIEKLARRVNALKPDVIAIAGDVIDGNALRVQPLIPALRTLQAPLGVWAVTGNHDYYAGIERSLRVFEEAGFRVLRDRSAVVTEGLVFAGVDDLGARGETSADSKALEHALNTGLPGATVLLSHTPWDAAKAAQLGASLMLCGHTHHGQIWPFNFLVRLRYSLIGGRYEINGMPVIISRGAGTWGPRMRLWYRSEIVLIHLRSGDGTA